MSTEASYNYPSDLNASLPLAADLMSEGDDHIRGTKNVIKTTFPNISGAVTPTHTEINYLVGVTSLIQTQLNSKLAAASAGMILLATASASSSATIDFTSLIDGTYDEYELHIVHAIPASSANTAFLRTTVDGSTWPASAGDYNYDYSSGSATAVTDGGTATAILLAQNVSTSASNGGVCAVVRLFSPSGATAKKRMHISSSVVNGSGGFVLLNGIAVRPVVTAVTGLRFLFSSGNIASGKFKLYGIAK